MSKTTNKQQLQLLLTLMEQEPEIARGFYKGNKENVGRFWRKVEVDLNTIGPPVKNITEWKKVWADQKKYVRQKAAQNLKSRRATGGGPNAEVKFSGIEEGIYNLIGMKESVEGVAANTFGLTPLETIEGSPSFASLVEEALQETVEKDMEAVGDNRKALSNKRQTVENKNYTPSEILQKEVNIQQEICGAIGNIHHVMKENHEAVRKIYKSLDKQYELRKSHFKKMEEFKKNEIEETKRHNIKMEEIRLREVESKIERNRLLMEIEKLKSRNN